MPQHIGPGLDGLSRQKLPGSTKREHVVAPATPRRRSPLCRLLPAATPRHPPRHLPLIPAAHTLPLTPAAPPTPPPRPAPPRPAASPPRRAAAPPPCRPAAPVPAAADPPLRPFPRRRPAAPPQREKKESVTVAPPAPQRNHQAAAPRPNTRMHWSTLQPRARAIQ